MNNERNRQENKKALKTFIPLVIVAAVVGGIVGGMASTDDAQSIAADIGGSLRELMYLLAPYGVIITASAGVLAAMHFYISAKKDYLQDMNNHMSAGDEVSEETLKSMDRKLSKGMLTMSAVMIISFIFFAAMIAYLDIYIERSRTLLYVTLACFVAGSFGGTKLQQMMIDLQKILNPEKQGSAYDLRFKEKWEESCDEMERLIIYKSAYKAYKAVNLACRAALAAMVMLSFFFDYGPLPAIMIGVVWLVATLSYCLEAMKLDKKKINE